MIEVLYDYLDNGTKHPHYDHMVDRAAFCRSMFAGGDGYEAMVRDIRPKEMDHQKDFRAKVSYPETPEVLEGVQTVVQRIFRVDGIREVCDHTIPEVKTMIEAKANSFSIAGSVTAYLKKRQPYYEFIDPNAWLIVESKTTRDEGGEIVDITPYPLEILSHHAVNYSVSGNGYEWLLVDDHAGTTYQYGIGYTYMARLVDDKSPPIRENEVIRASESGSSYAVSVYDTGTDVFPGMKFGSYDDHSVDDMTVKAPIYDPARNVLKRIVRNSSLASVQLVTHIYNRMYGFDTPCDFDGGYGAGCGNKESTDPNCPACGGTGSNFHYSETDLVRIQYPADKDEAVSLSDLLHIVEPPLGPTRLLLETLENDKRRVPFSIFNSNTVEQPVVSTTATEQRFNWENANNRVAPFGDHNSALHVHCFMLISQHLQSGQGFTYGHSYPKALDLEPEDSIIARYGNARSVGLPAAVVRSIGSELALARFGGDPLKRKNFESVAKFNRFTHLSNGEALAMLSARASDDPARVLYENYGWIETLIYERHPPFFSYDFEEQRKIVDEIVEEVISEMKLSIEVSDFGFAEAEDGLIMEASGDEAGQGDLDSASAAGEVPAVLLNGAQVAALVKVVADVAALELPVPAAVEIMKNAFGFTTEKAIATLGGAGTTFVKQAEIKEIDTEAA